jgi:hypothetical protein
MALVFRAIWTEDRTGLLGIGSEAFLTWLRSKGLTLESLPDGELLGEYYDPRLLPIDSIPYELSVVDADAQDVRAKQIRFVERQDGDRQRWTTTMTILSNDQAGGTFWVDVERVADDPFARVDFRAPRLVKDLIDQGDDPRVGDVRLSSGPKVIEADG